ncbi:MAG TPA: DUF4932 domain-containing protein [Chitinophagaceae bacterium]|nr:DUF4932 domain-containing protein [Chitinophagaceae bacterium]
MKHFFCAALFIAYGSIAIAQSTEEIYPKTLQSPADSFMVRFSNFPNDLITMKYKTRDTLDMGTDGAPGLKATIYYGKDSLVIPYRNLPYAQVHYIPIQMPAHKVMYRLHFNSITANFSQSYMNSNTGKVQVEIPEVYELANILWTLSPAGQRSSTLYKEGAYYQKVTEYFKPWLNHPVFRQLDVPDSLFFQQYYDFRENSFTYNFKGNELVYEGPYYYVMGNDWDNYNSLFRKLLPLITDFVKQSKYREFYKSNQSYYAERIERMKQLNPVKSMWTWLEKEFPNRKYQSYKIVFSPLIGGSHSTQQFWTYNKDKWFAETVMFVCATDRYDARKELNDKQREGLMSGIVFTEIDHNYVNPASNRYAGAIDSALSKRSVWTGDSTNWYGNPMAVFNEYMTHSVFCLWVMDNYDKPTAEFVINEREKLMVERRKFIRFKEFNQALIALREKNRDKAVVDLYPAIVDWCRRLNPSDNQ